MEATEHREASRLRGSLDSPHARPQVLYAMSKGALNSMQSALVPPLLEAKIRINTVSPGATDTDMVGHMDQVEISKAIPMGRFGMADEIAAGVVFLLSDAASYISGANIRIAGGRP
jgi:NAD(P)-dependent dehydrogenase (short-subunit alcohol dehydrogenase family)